MTSRVNKFRDFDTPDDGMNRVLAGYYDAAAERLRSLIIAPTGKHRSTQQWTQARAASIAAQINREMRSLRSRASVWTGHALSLSFRQGVETADQQAVSAGILSRSDAPSLRGSFHVVDTDAVRQFARDTYGDLAKAADAMESHAQTLLRRMAAEGVTNEEVNRILAGGVIEGRPTAAIRELRVALEKVHGKKVVIQTQSGPRAYDVDGYAHMVANTKTREAVCKARHERLVDMGMDLVTIVGRHSKNPCTAYLDKVFSISGKSKKYPPLRELPRGGPPFHPNCSKSTAPFVEELATPEELAAAEPDRKTSALMQMNWKQQTAAFGNERFQEQIKQRHDDVVASITKGRELPQDFSSQPQADVFTDKTYGAWSDQIRSNPTQHDALVDYQDKSQSREINAAMRSGSFADPTLKMKADEIARAIESAPPLQHDMYVYRGTDYPAWHDLANQFHDNLDERWAGRIITDNAFVSTSVTSGSAHEYLDRERRNAPVFMQIILPKGTKAACLDAVTEAGDSELLLPPPVNFKVVQAVNRIRNGKPYVHLTARYINAGK